MTSASFGNAFTNFLMRGFANDFGFIQQCLRQLSDERLHHQFLHHQQCLHQCFGKGSHHDFGIINNTSINSSARCPLHLHQNFGVERSPSISSKEFLTSASQERLAMSAFDKQSIRRQKLCLAPMNESFRTCRDLL